MMVAAATVPAIAEAPVQAAKLMRNARVGMSAAPKLPHTTESLRYTRLAGPLRVNVRSLLCVSVVLRQLLAEPFARANRGNAQIESAAQIH